MLVWRCCSAGDHKKRFVPIHRDCARRASVRFHKWVIVICENVNQQYSKQKMINDNNSKLQNIIKITVFYSFFTFESITTNINIYIYYIYITFILYDFRNLFFAEHKHFRQTSRQTLIILLFKQQTAAQAAGYSNRKSLAAGASTLWDWRDKTNKNLTC